MKFDLHTKVFTILVIAFATVITSIKTFAQEKMAPYPNLSFQGVFGNPAEVHKRGDWAWFGTLISAKDGAKTLDAELSKSIDGLQLYGGILSSNGAGGDGYFLNASTPLNYQLSVGGTFSSGNKNGVMGLVFTPRHDSVNLTQTGVQYDFQADALRLAAEIRQMLGTYTLTFSGQMTGGKKEDGKLDVIDKGVGFQVESGRVRASAGCGGKSWRDVTFAAQIRAGKGVLPDLGITIPQGRAKDARIWVGVTALLPRR